MSMERALLVDANFSAAPIYDALLKADMEVYVCGGNPQDFLAKCVEKYIEIDYANVEKVRQLAASLGVKYIVPGCNDRSYLVCAEVNGEREYPGLDNLAASAILNNKDQFRAFATKIGIPVPHVIAQPGVGHQWPVIVKPTDAYSGRGITILRQQDAVGLDAAIELAKKFSRTNTCIAEEYVEGQLYSHSAFISKNKIVADFIVEEFCNTNPFVVDTSHVVADFPKAMLSKIREAVLAMSSELSLVDGLIHTQFIANEDTLWLIEVTRRCPGDLYSKLIEDSTGFPYAEAYASPFVTRKFAFSAWQPRTSFVLRHTISRPNEGVFRYLQLKHPALVERFVPLSIAGDMVKASPFGRIGLLFLRCNTQTELNNLVRTALDRELYEIH